MADRHRVGIIGARGHAGAELIRILNDHPYVEVDFAGSRELAGEPVPSIEGLRFENLGPDEVASRHLDAVFMALPDGIGSPWVEEVPSQTVVVDISAGDFQRRGSCGRHRLRIGERHFGGDRRSGSRDQERQERGGETAWKPRHGVTSLTGCASGPTLRHCAVTRSTLTDDMVRIKAQTAANRPILQAQTASLPPQPRTPPALPGIGPRHLAPSLGLDVDCGDFERSPWTT